MIERQQTLDPFTDQTPHCVVWLNIEDDNIGIVPQQTGPDMAALVKLIRKKKLEGFFTRQFLQSKMLLNLSYLAHASWDRKLTPEASYRQLFNEVCGPQAMEPLMRAVRVLTKNTREMYEHLDCISFLVPQIVANFISVTQVEKPPGQPTEAKRYQRHERICHQYRKASKLLVEAVRLSRPAGRDVIDAMRCQVDFALSYIAGQTAMQRASDWRIQFVQAQEVGDIDAMIQAQDAIIASLATAQDHFVVATQSWAEGIEDRGDLNVLACLNHYVVGAVKSLNQLTSLEDFWAREP